MVLPYRSFHSGSVSNERTDFKNPTPAPESSFPSSFPPIEPTRSTTSFGDQSKLSDYESYMCTHCEVDSTEDETLNSAVPESSDYKMVNGVESYMRTRCEADSMEDEEMLNSAGPRRSSCYKIIDGVPVRRNGIPCGNWKGYAVLDRFDTTRILTCLVEIEEWVHLVEGMVKLYDQYNNPNGELSREDYILYRKDPERFTQMRKNRFSMEPVRRSPYNADETPSQHPKALASRMRPTPVPTLIIPQRRLIIIVILYSL
ncbi:hypothetical protein BT96DRAFT_1007618 [Gymnopus androsaceus JB14]|uniref:Uncharacterized protein n=1 Tax=Gymnopus androsaceus JB14 TaxID=1447944 RepID=A0A6A4GHQ3_9AGAR|nr:hypothetical protein BT96DRAFT_1007618 [Gymnopus androsaceus JB14]